MHPLQKHFKVYNLSEKKIRYIYFFFSLSGRERRVKMYISTKKKTQSLNFDMVILPGLCGYILRVYNYRSKRNTKISHTCFQTFLQLELCIDD